MVDVNELYPSKYLAAHELKGREVTVIIDRVERAEMTDGQVKACVYFEGKGKGLLLNKTNAMTIASIYGPNSNGWIGKAITIGTSWVDFKGTQTEGLRVRPRVPQTNDGFDTQAPAPVQQQAAPPPAQRQNAYSQARPDLDDEVPF